METKDNCQLWFEDKQNNVTENDKYSNFTLKQSHQISSDAFSGRSKSVASESKKALNYERIYHSFFFDKHELNGLEGTAASIKLSDFVNKNNSQTKKDSHLWNKSTKNLSPFFVNNGFGKKERLKKGKNLNASTLSLHIEAYENSNKANSCDETKEGLKKNNLIEKGFNAKQLDFDSTAVIQNPFEFPRQQENGKSVNPETAQYKASQQLHNPNQMRQAQAQQQRSTNQNLAPESSSSSGNESSSDGEGNVGNLTPAEFSFINDTIEKLMRAPLKFHRGGAKGELVQKASRTKPIAPDVDITLTKSDVLQICELAADSFLKQKSLIEIRNDMLPLSIFGDIHGQFRDLRMMLHAVGHPEDHAYVFLGDYVDRGPQGIEGLCLLLCLKIKYPHRVFMLRGNHEDFNTSMVYGFYDECIQKFNNDAENLIFQNFVHVFNCMPFAALIGGRILTMHGGISPDLTTLNDINLIKRPTLIPLHGLATDIVWSDPGGKNPGWAQSNRGISFTYDNATIEKFCRLNNIDLIVRGHQITNEMQNTGYQFTANNRMLTIFSAFNYLNTNNTGATLQILPNMKCRFRLFRPVHPKKIKQTAPEVIPPLTATVE